LLAPLAPESPDKSLAAAFPNLMERETGIEPATNSLEGCDSTTELLPPVNRYQLSAVSSKPNPQQQTDFFLRTFKSLEPMIRIELMTSPLPRECSTN
jgi:hypothetical protein